MGQLANATHPFGIKKGILTTEVRWVFTPPVAANNVTYKLEVVYPVASISGLTDDVPETGPIMLPITWQPRQDPANGYVDHYILLTTTETAAALATAAPEIGAVPRTDLHPYNCVQGIVSASPSPSTTVFASDAAAAPFPALSSTNDAYNTLELLFTTGTLAGVKRAISDYVGSTRTFTVGSAFGGAPSAGDKFVIIGGWGL